MSGTGMLITSLSALMLPVSKSSCTLSAIWLPELGGNSGGGVSTLIWVSSVLHCSLLSALYVVIALMASETLFIVEGADVCACRVR